MRHRAVIFDLGGVVLGSPLQAELDWHDFAHLDADRDLIAGNPLWEQNMRALCTDLRAPIILPGIGHWTQQEAPDAVSRAMIDFLKSLA